jgi:hypothetical protein
MPSTFKFALPFRCKSLGRLQKTEERAQLTEFVGRLDVSSREIHSAVWQRAAASKSEGESHDEYDGLQGM